jgi:uncharacterized membrane protein YgcG
MKIQLILAFFILFSVVESSSSLTSEDIIKGVDALIKNKTMDFDKNYFTFDLNDYTGLNADKKKRSTFTQKQKNLYDKYGIKNYFFIIDDFDSSSTSIETLARSLQSYIAKSYTVNMSNSVIFVIAIDQRKMRLEIGKTLNKIIDDTKATEIINSMGLYMRNLDYYNALNNALNVIEYYYTNK